jgi:hypothetical protein
MVPVIPKPGTKPREIKALQTSLRGLALTGLGK